MKHTSIIALVAVVAAGTAMAAEVSTPRQRPVLAIDLNPGSGAPAAETEGEWESPVATIYNSNDCSLPVECAIVTLDCSSGLLIAVESIDEATLAKWLAEPGEMGIEVSGMGPEVRKVEAWEMQRSELDGQWSVIFRADYTSDPGLMLEGDALSIKASPRTVTLPLSGDNRAKLEQFVQLCARE